MKILTHRGLQPTAMSHPKESSYAAFEKQLKDGFSLEFDSQPYEKGLVVSHRPSEDAPKLEEILELIASFEQTDHGLHVKYTCQTPQALNLLINELKNQPKAAQRLFLFDLTPESIAFVKQSAPELAIGITVAHPYDIERFNDCVGQTLWPLHEALQITEHIDWVWLDEWDTLGPNRMRKTLYNAGTFEAIREKGLKIAVASPELHASSPDLLGGEAHADGESLDTTLARLKEVIALGPDIICTDYPQEVRALKDELLSRKT